MRREIQSGNYLYREGWLSQHHDIKVKSELIEGVSQVSIFVMNI